MSIRRVSELPILDSTNVSVSAFNDSFLEISYQNSPEEPKKYISKAMRGSALRDILSAAISASSQTVIEQKISALDGMSVKGGMELSGNVSANQGDPQYTKYACQARFGSVGIEGRTGVELSSQGTSVTIRDSMVAIAPAATVEQTVAADANSVVNVGFLTQRLQELYDQITAMIPDVPEQTVYYLDVESEDASMGVATGGGSNTTGVFSIEATPNSGYAFSKWVAGGSCSVPDVEDSSTLATSTAKVAGWATATAVFVREDPTLPSVT